MLHALSALLLLTAAAPQVQGQAQSGPAFQANARLGRGINLGNALDAPSEGEWGVTLEASYFEAIAAAGFDSVRIPIRWSAHAMPAAPYTIDPAFFERVDWAVDQATSRGLNAIVNMHHYEEIYAGPEDEADRFLTLWEQIAERYADRPDSVVFELLNEPHGRLDAAAWNDLLDEAIDVVRQSNPRRFLIVGPSQWNSLDKLPELKLPKNDRRIIATFHYYSPFEFTHQGAEWVGRDAQEWLGTTWTATPEQREAVTEQFDAVARWSREHDRPVFLGEFGAYSKAPDASRATWTAFIRAEAERRGFSWSYWEFCSGFGAYDPRAKHWRAALLEALVPDSPALQD